MIELDCLSQDVRYSQARAVVDQKVDYRNETANPALLSSFKVFQQLAEENYGKSYYPLSRLYEANQDIDDNQERARHFAQLAFNWCYANRANQDAELWGDLGEMYLHGNGVEQNDEQAVFWYRKAGELGYAESQFNLGHMYSIGMGVPEDENEMVKWWRLAAAQGHVLAQLNLASRLTWPGESQDYEDAAKWYCLAAVRGSYTARKELCKLYVSGRGVPQNYEEAEKLLQLLLNQGGELETDLRLVQEILRLNEELTALKKCIR